ncbi:hypothetical protein [Streptomyces toxytricini]|uniref:hypothetical protein n=1 Tax=Streptomyces toxytricini TaxID=67369 RepID=UPI003441FBF1
MLLAAARPGTGYDPAAATSSRPSSPPTPRPAAAREAELREAVRIVARANHLQVLRDLGTLNQAEPAGGDEAARDELTRRAGGYVQADVDAWLAYALAVHRGHYPSRRSRCVNRWRGRRARTILESFRQSFESPLLMTSAVSPVGVES